MYPAPPVADGGDYLGPRPARESSTTKATLSVFYTPNQPTIHAESRLGNNLDESSLSIKFREVRYRKLTRPLTTA